MCGSTADIQSPTAEIRRGKKEEKRNRMKLEMSANAQRDGRGVFVTFMTLHIILGLLGHIAVILVCFFRASRFFYGRPME